MTWRYLLLCLWAALLWTAEARPSSLERLPDGTDVMLSSMGMVERGDQPRELSQLPQAGQRPDAAAGAALLGLADNFGMEDRADIDGAQLRQLLLRLLPVVPSLQPPRERRSSNSKSSSISAAQHQQLTRQLLRRYSELQKRSYPYRSNLFRQPRGYMCLSKVCNFKGARGK